MGKSSTSQTLPLVLRKFQGQRPKCLSRTSVELVKDSLRKGCVSLLTKWGGWQRESFLRNQAAKKGRLWERTSPVDLGLTFSAETLKLLIWLTDADCSDPKVKWVGKKGQPLTLGDQFFWFLVIRCLRETELVDKLAKHPLVSSNGLISLAYPKVFAKFNIEFEPDFKPWIDGCGGAILETMQKNLAKNWVEIENSKSLIVSPRKMLRLGATQI